MDDFAIWDLISHADGHILFAHFGRYSPAARASLYRRAAGLLMRASALLLERATEEEGGADLARAEAMLRRSYGK